MNTDKPVILFDGVCNLCNRSVQFVIRRDPQGIFRFAALQSEFGSQLLKEFNLPANTFNSFILYQDHKIYTRSTGAIKMITQLPGWKWAKALYIFPRFLRDGIYNLVAKYRYSWFGKKDACMIPTKELKERFID